MENRITREELFMCKALLTAKRSSCLKKDVGIVAVKDHREICSGYNGVLSGYSPKTGIKKDGTTQTVHAEANMISYAARKGISLEGSTVYITLSPCIKCAELIIQSGITKLYYYESYRDTEGLDLLKEHLEVLPYTIGADGLQKL